MKPSLLVLNHFPTGPRVAGGQLRVFSVCDVLSSQFGVTLLTLAQFDSDYTETRHSSDFEEVNFPITPAAVSWSALNTQFDGAVSTDCSAHEIAKLTPGFMSRLRKDLSITQLIGLSHPYFAPLISELVSKQPIWLDMHNFESTLAEESGNLKHLRRTREVEGIAWKLANIISYCNSADHAGASRMYGETSARSIYAPNGASSDWLTAGRPDTKLAAKLKARYKITGRAAIFIGSDHPPNRECLARLLKIAREVQQLTILVVGSVCNAAIDNELPNVRMLGVVDDEELIALMSLSSLALNPMTSGSGSNIKLLLYMSRGIPIISTSFGARGIDVKAGRDYIEAEADQFSQVVASTLVNSPLTRNVSANARKFAESHSWETCIARLSKEMLGMLETK